MVTRKIGKLTVEDSFGTPAAARGGMMKVSGQTDDDLDRDDDLLTDAGCNEVISMRLGDLRSLVRGFLR